MAPHKGMDGNAGYVDNPLLPLGKLRGVRPALVTLR